MCVLYNFILFYVYNILYDIFYKQMKVNSVHDINLTYETGQLHVLLICKIIKHS